MKKLLILLMAFGLFAAACGDDDDTETGSSGSSSEASDSGSEMAEDDDMAEEGLSVDEINVAYFAQWPTPNQFGQADGSFGDAVGATINWLPFNSGGEMTEAMIAGDVDIAYSQGLTPFAGAINGGADLKLVGIAVSYAEADNCVARGDLGVTRDNAAEVLDGATVMTPLGNVTHYKMLSMMDFLGVDLASLNVLQAEGGDTTAAAMAAGDIDVGCAFGGSIVTMLDAGNNLIMTGAEHESDIGIFTYDIVSIPTSFGEEHGDAVTAFLAATEEFNQAWAADMEGRNDTIAQAAGMEDVANFLGGDLWFVFPTIDEQLGADWLGGNVADAMQGQVETLAELGGGEPAIGDFAGSVDTSFLEAAQG
ncbi:MAG: ABC transporter substrate-binding protein [Actinomycetota bacterium]